MTRQPNAIILDANCYDHLADERLCDDVVRSLASVGSSILPTDLNVLEIAKHTHAGKRARLFATVRRILRDRPLLPLPYELLKLTGEAALRSETGIEIRSSVCESLLIPPDEITAEDQLRIVEYFHPLDLRFEAVMEKARPQFKALLETQKRRNPWANAREFLDYQWNEVSLREWIIAHDWERLGFEGVPPFEALLKQQTWRLHFDSFGAALYQRAIAANASKKVHATDISQCLYLGGHRGRTFVTADVGCFQVVNAVVDGRHANARAMQWKSFLAKTIG